MQRNDATRHVAVAHRPEACLPHQLRQRLLLVVRNGEAEHEYDSNASHLVVKLADGLDEIPAIVGNGAEVEGVGGSVGVMVWGAHW